MCAVISTYEDPIPGWSNNLYGINGAFVGWSVGLLKVSSSELKTKNEVVCADFVTNATLAAIWDKAHEKNSQTDDIDESKTIVHITSQDPLNWGNEIFTSAV